MITFVCFCEWVKDNNTVESFRILPVVIFCSLQLTISHVLYFIVFFYILIEYMFLVLFLNVVIFRIINYECRILFTYRHDVLYYRCLFAFIYVSTVYINTSDQQATKGNVEGLDFWSIQLI